MNTISDPPAPRFSPTLRFNPTAANTAFPGVKDWHNNQAPANALRSADRNYWSGLSEGTMGGGLLGAGLGGLLGLLGGSPWKGLLLGGLLGTGLGAWTGHNFGKNESTQALNAAAAAAAAKAKL